MVATRVIKIDIKITTSKDMMAINISSGIE